MTILEGHGMFFLKSCVDCRAWYLFCCGPLDFTSRMPFPHILGEERYNTALGVQKVLQNYKNFQDIIALLGMDELSEDHKLTVA